MFFYLFVFALCLFLNSLSSRKRPLFLFLSCLILSLIAGFRDWTIGTDTMLYPPLYMDVAQHIHSLYDLFEDEYTEHLDRGFLLVYCVASWMGNQYWIGFFIIELIITFFTFAGLLRLSRFFNGGIFFFTYAFLFLVFNYSMNAMRQECAISIAFFAFSYLWEKKWIPYICWTLVAYTFHSSALVTLLLPILLWVSSIRREGLRTIVVAGIIGGMVFVTITFWSLLEFIGQLGLFNEAYAGRYGEGSTLEENEGLPTIPVALCIIYYYLSYTSYRKKIINSSILCFQFMVNSLYMVALFLSLLNQYLYRIGLYFQIITIYFISIEISSKKSNPIIKYIIVLAIAIYWFRHYVIRNSSETIPYTSTILGIN